MAVLRDDYRSWGGTLRGTHSVARPGSIQDAVRDLRVAADPVLAFGCGRSYGDVALNPGGTLVDCTGLNRFVEFDRTCGVLTCEAGVSLAQILEVICRPDADGSAWMLPVSPGTRFVSVAGAIANDVHGKNHHGFGTFGRHVLSFELLRGDGTRLTCSAAENAALFGATIGGLGLTGLILRATLQLRRVPGLGVEAEDIRFGNLAEFFVLSGESDGSWEYTAAWVDCLAGGRAMGRGIFTRARSVPGNAPVPPPLPSLRMPIEPVGSLVSPLTARTFNALYYRRLGLRRRRLGRRSYAAVMYPLDAVHHWNRVYGRQGFYQFQSVVPPPDARAATGEMLRIIALAGEGSALSVLKCFGDLPSPGLLSFPMPGVTLALDFPNRGDSTRRLLQRLEDIAVAAGGRLYPAKDALMSAQAFRRGYPDLETFRSFIDPRFCSAFARRVGLVESPSGAVPGVQA